MTKAELKRLKTATEKLTQWDSSKKCFGHLLKIKVNAATTKGADKIYEFYCLMRILEDLQVNYSVKIRPGTKKGKIFPESPAQKAGWPLFEIENKADTNNKYQVCYGTKIKLTQANKTTIAPDISIQKHDATDDPDETMVELIMDAKFKYDSSKALPIDQLHGFMQRVSALKTSNANAISLALNNLKDLRSNCLLTNGLALTDQDDYCKLGNIKQVEKFDTTSTYNVVG